MLKTGGGNRLPEKTRTFSLFGEKGEEFRRAFPHLSACIEDAYRAVVCMCELGDVDGIVPLGFDASAYPRIVSVSFDEERASRFERDAERACRERKLCGEAVYPRPDFPVSLGFDLFGEEERFPVDLFAAEEGLRALCIAVVGRARAAYRRRYALPPR